jgi:phage terminase large subunit-like protein
MQLEKLRKLADEALSHPHYRLKDKVFQPDAVKSFSRIPDDQKTQVQESWRKYLVSQGKKNASDSALNKEELTELVSLRFLSQTNLFFLCNLLEKYSQVTVPTHEDICNDFFVQKDPTFGTFEQFANQYTPLKDRMLLVPRGGFKSSIDIADCVQWIISFPAVTILILTGVFTLAQDFVGELRGHFEFEETGEADEKDKKKPKYGPRKMQDRETGEWTPSLFQVLFPEHCIRPGDGKAMEFQTPAAKSDKEPTVRAASIEQALSGMHFGVLKLDDVVTNENSLTTSRMEAVNKQISVNRAMLHPYGFMDVIGTWYDEQDYYGITIKSEEQLAKEDGLLDCVHGSVDDGKFDSAVNVRIYLRAAWWPTEKAKKEGKIESEMKREHWELWFPERLTYDFLYRESRKPNSQFAIKYLNNPRKENKVKFPKELLLRCTVPHTQVPPQGLVVTTVDTAYSVQNWADYTVIMTALIYGGRFYIINMVRGRFNEYELPAVIAATGYKWKPKRIVIEDSVGVKWMGRELRREMDKLQISIPVEYDSLGFGSKAKSKQLKAKPVRRLLGDGRLFFTLSCEGLSELYDELEKFTGTSDDTHDDIVSAISLLVEKFAAYAEMEAKVNFAESQYVSDRQSKERHDQIYGLGRYSRYNAANAVIDDNPVTQFQVGQQTETVTDIDPLQDLFR